MELKPTKASLDIGIVVSNIEKSLAFYQGLLGLKKTEELEVPFGRMHRLVFGTSDVKLIDPKTVPPAGLAGLETQLGVRYFTFPISNLNEVVDDLIAKGADFAIPKTELRPGVTIVMLRDPDGNFVELVEKR